MCSDHLAPWTRAQGHSGFAWSWLGAALEATSLTFGTVSAPGQRYHPSIVAQAAATLSQMYPGRFWVALGSGEALNEHVTGQPWPPKPERNARLRESTLAIRALLGGETVSLRGRIVVDRARVYSLPPRPPPLYGAAVSPATASFLAPWTDGLITASQPEDDLRAVVAAYRANGGEGKPLLLQAQVSWAPDRREAERAALHEWAMSALDSDLLWDLDTPEAVEAATANVRASDLDGLVEITDDLGALAQRIGRWRQMGFSAVYLHNVGRNQREFLAAASSGNSGRRLVAAAGTEERAAGDRSGRRHGSVRI